MIKLIFLLMTVSFAVEAGEWHFLEKGVERTQVIAWHLKDEQVYKIYHTTEIEMLLWRYLSLNGLDIQKMSLYNYQYQATSEGQVYISGFCRAPREKYFDLDKTLYSVDGGGKCYFKVKYTVLTKQFSGLQFNSLR